MATGASVLLFVGLSFFVVGLVTCHNGDQMCCKRNKKQTRKRACQGPILGLSKELCRVAQVPTSSFACLSHRRELEKQNKRCSCPLATHSSGLSAIPIPGRLYQFFDELGATQNKYQPGTRWCLSCRNAFKKDEQVTAKCAPPSYIPPKKRSHLKVIRKPDNTLLFFSIIPLLVSKS